MTCRIRTAGLALVVVAVCGGALRAQDGGSAPTAMFRAGPAHTGVYDQAVSGRAFLGLQWRFVTEGDVIGSPAIAGDVVYVGSGDGYMYALDRATGAVRWKRDMGSPIASSPAVGTRRVFFGTRDGRFHALDAATGEVRWRLATGPDFPWPWGHESGDVYTSSPVHVDGTVIFGSGDGRVYAFDARTAKERWRASTGGRVRSSPAVADGRVYVGSADGRVYAFDLATGALKWRYDTEGVQLDSRNFGYDRRTVQSSPAVSGGTVFVGARDGFLYAIDAATGQLRWRFDHKISWVNTSPAVRDTVVYAGSSDGQFVQAVHTGTGRELWRAKAGVTWSSPAVAGDVVYAGDGAGRMNAFDRRSGDPLWSFRTGSQVYGSPVPAGDLVLFGSTDAGVYALRVGPGPPVHRAVFFDSTYLKAAWVADPGLLSRYFVNRGYTLVDARGLGEFLEARAADRSPSVVVFAIDHLPPSAVDTSALERSAIRRYLDAGGKVVWPGVPPLLFVRDPQTGNVGGLAALKWAAPTRLLGVEHEAAMFDVRGVRATAQGKKWGLPNRWRSNWGITPDSSITVLGRDELGLTTSWVRRYGGAEGTGFVRVPADDPMVVYLAAEYRPGTK
jgi:eukaryotic-like serine/threonine-protein kinase